MEIIRPIFGTPPKPEGQAMGGMTTKAASRRMARIRKAVEALPLIPGPEECLHGLMTGSYDLAHLLTVLLDKLGSPCQRMHVATLSLSTKNVAEMCGWLDDGKVKNLDLLVSDFCRKNDKEIFNGLLVEFTKRGQRVAAARSHCKIVALALEDGRRFIMEGSANLRTNSNCEQFTLTNSPALHGFYELWLDEMVSKHEIVQGRATEAT
jgi:hypothetical protein